MGKFNKKLSPHQQWVADNEQPLVIARWGRRTGKDTVAKHILRKGDTVVFASERMEELQKDEFRSGVQMTNEHEILGDEVSEPIYPTRVFFSEFGIFTEPIKMLNWADSARQIYLVSTPHNTTWRGVNIFDALGYWMRGTDSYNHAPAPPEVMKMLDNAPLDYKDFEGNANFPKGNDA